MICVHFLRSDYHHLACLLCALARSAIYSMSIAMRLNTCQSSDIWDCTVGYLVPSANGLGLKGGLK